MPECVSTAEWLGDGDPPVALLLGEALREGDMLTVPPDSVTLVLAEALDDADTLRLSDRVLLEVSETDEDAVPPVLLVLWERELDGEPSLILTLAEID